MILPSIARGDLYHQPPAYLEPEEDEDLEPVPPEVMASFFLVDLPFILGTVTRVKEGEGIRCG